MRRSHLRHPTIVIHLTISMRRAAYLLPLLATLLVSCESTVEPEPVVEIDVTGLRLEGVLTAGAAEAPVDSEVLVAVRVLDGAGAPAQDVPVRWEAVQGEIVSQAVARSDAQGIAAAVWQLGTVAGPQRASALVQGQDASRAALFAVEGLPGRAVSATLEADTVLLSARRETAFLAPGFQDEFGNVTSEVAEVTWRSSDPGVVDVAADGLVTAVEYGDAWIVPSLETAVDSIHVTVVPRGAITVTFDDGFRTAYDHAIPVMAELGLRGNVGVYTEAVGWPDYMTEAHLQDLHDAGWSMASHTVSHDSLTQLSAADLDYELRVSRDWLDARGFRGADIFIAPYHDYGDRERLSTALYYTAARGESANRVSPDSLVAWRPDNPFRLTGIDAEALPYTTDEGRERLRTLLRRTADEGTFLDVFFHRVPPENADAIRATLEVVAEFRERVLPYHELFPVFARTVR